MCAERVHTVTLRKVARGVVAHAGREVRANLTAVNSPSKLRVFVASPGDASDERAEALNCVERVNSELAKDGESEFELVGWEIVRGTAQRPQEAINELIDSCDYLICVFRRSWGSDPGGTLGFTSGTEEELFTALLGLGREAHPMRDVWLAFVDADGVSTEVTDLKIQIQTRHALMYETVADVGDFREKLEQRLTGWATATRKEPRDIDLLPRSGRDLLGADRLRRKGESLVKLGQFEFGVAKLQEAVAIGGPPERIAYARVLERQGDIAAAREQVDQAIDQLTRASANLNTPSVAEAFACQASLLRREQRDFEAKQRLTQALALLQQDDEYTNRVRCRILDDLGLAHQKLKELDDAKQRFLEALEIRDRTGDPHSIAQSEVNLARNAVARGDLSAGEEYSRAALKRVRSLPSSALLANAYLLRAQVLLRLGDSTSAIEHAQWSAVLNTQLGNNYGAAMAQNVLAQAQAKAGNRDEAEVHAKISIEINAQMGVKAPPSVLRVLAGTR
jgi:tetratricopeptide (TPR) repeat protein